MKSLKINSNEYQKELKVAWKHFINNEDYDYSFIRPEILASWKRSRTVGVDPINTDYHNLTQNELNYKINKNISLINIVHPYIENLYSIVEGSSSYILLCDRDGYVIGYKGDEDIIAKGDTTKLGPGSVRKESDVGTNGIGTALYLKKPIQIWGQEHYSEKHKDYTCSGAPFYDADGNLSGCLNITVSIENAHPHTLGMVVCAADSITKELQLRQALENIEIVNAQRNSIIENMTSGVILLNALDRVIQINQYALQLLGLAYENVIGQNIFDYIMIDNYDRYSVHTILKKEKYNEEVTLFVGSASTRPKRLNLSISHVKDSNGAINGTMLRFNKPELINKLVKNISGFHANYTFDSIIGTSPLITKMKRESEKAAQSKSNVLILGESGTGKELVAQSIHNASDVSDGPFVAINCAAIPNSLVESELFGYEKGSFTGAEREGRPGKFEMADGGTIFLDEIGDMPFNVQAALLRVIQTKEVVRIGGRFPKPVNIRIIAATNQNLLHCVQQKSFRQDLYYRLNVITIAVPPLRSRGGEDVKALTTYFVQQYNAEQNTEIIVSPQVYKILQAYHWPGNVRQLENVLERALNLCDGNQIDPEHLPPLLTEEPEFQITSVQPNEVPHDPAKTAIRESPGLNHHQNEKALIIAALEKSKGNVTIASELLEMNRRTLYRKLEKYQINNRDYK